MKVLLGANVNKDCEDNYISPPAPKCSNEVLKRENYLSEFRTKAEKQKVLENLGLSSKLEWGQIGGYIEHQADLWKYIKSILESLENKIAKELFGKQATTQIKYSNSAYPTLVTLQDALDRALYKDIEINMTIDPSIVEIGTTVQQITYNWTCNKSNIIEQKFDGRVIDSSLRTITILGPFTENVTKTLSINDGTESVEKSITLYFYPAILYGTSLDNATHLLQGDRNCTVTVDCTDNKDTHIVIAIPYDYGEPTFTVNGFDGGFQLTNDNYILSNKVRYRVYTSDNGGLGVTTIKIS